MTTLTLILRSLTYFWRTHAGVALGAAVGSAVLIGALVVGDSVRYSLRQQALNRLGKIDVSVSSHDRYFRDALADDLKLEGATVAPVLKVDGTALNRESRVRANNVRLLGVDKRFWSLSPNGQTQPKFPDGSVLISDRLATHLAVKIGDSVLIRIATPSVLPRDAPLSTTNKLSVALELKVAGVLSTESFGRFNLRPDPVPPFNAVVSLDYLQKESELPGKANVLLVGGASVDQANEQLGRQWQLADVELELRDLEKHGVIELRTDRIFLDGQTVVAAKQAHSNPTTILTYFVNELKGEKGSTPYSIVSAMSTSDVVPRGMADDRIVVNQWLADELKLVKGDELSVRYYVLGTSREVKEESTTFTVANIVATEGPGGDRDLMPNFPGIAEVDSASNWKPGIPVDTSLMVGKPDAYWKEYRGTPKAFVTLAAGQKLWQNRYGNVTAVRYPREPDGTTRIADAFRKHFAPSDLGIVFQPVREQALASSRGANDFGMLFLSLSFFLVTAALILMGLLFVFGVEHRSAQIGTLMAMGFTGKKVRQLLMAEGVVLAIIGAIAGTAGGLFYTKALVHGLSKADVWGGAIGAASVIYHAEPATITIGFASGIVVALFTVWLSVRRLSRARPNELLKAGADRAAIAPTTKAAKKSVVTAVICIVGAIGLLAAFAGAQGQAAAGGFFGAGSLLLIGGLCFSYAFLSKLSRAQSAAFASVGSLGLRGSARRRGRSVATICLLASGIFLVIAVGAFRIDANENADKPESGTGGYALVGETDFPLLFDLNSDKGKEEYALDGGELDGVNVVQFRVREGDDASCLNLNQARQPTLLGVAPRKLEKRFTFAKTIDGRADGWSLLNEPTEDGVINGIGDMNTIMWGLHVSVGDVVPAGEDDFYVDERGNRFKVKVVGMLANSILQGPLVVSERALIHRFQSNSGYRRFLFDVKPDRAKVLNEDLSFVFEDYGLQLTPAPQRLADFSRVQNTYLDIFQALGGLGLLLGSVGLGVVVLRNILERRGELGLLRAIGFANRTLQWLLLSEHWLLLLLGLVIGVVTAVVAVLPMLMSPGAKVPYESMALTAGGIVISGLVWTWLAAALALRGGLMSALREE